MQHFFTNFKNLKFWARKAQNVRWIFKKKKKKKSRVIPSTGWLYVDDLSRSCVKFARFSQHEIVSRESIIICTLSIPRKLSGHLQCNDLVTAICSTTCKAFFFFNSTSGIFKMDDCFKYLYRTVLSFRSSLG